MTASVAKTLNSQAVELKDYTARAVVDWVAFTVKLGRASEGGYLKRWLEKHGVSQAEPITAGTGNAATQFLIRLQHPERFAVIQAVLDDLDGRYRLVEPPIVQALEVSLDFVGKGPDPMLQEITEELMRSLVPPVITNPRVYDKGLMVGLPDRQVQLDPEMTLYIGNDKDDLLWRVYWKRTDETSVGEDGKRHPKPLPEDEWRARAEVRVQGAALVELGIKRPLDLQHFAFERLHAQGYFKFARYAANEPIMGRFPVLKLAAKSLGVHEQSPGCVLGMFGRYDQRRRRLKYSRYLETDTVLTEMARQALRKLTQRF